MRRVVEIGADDRPDHQAEVDAFELEADAAIVLDRHVGVLLLRLRAQQIDEQLLGFAQSFGIKAHVAPLG